MAILHIQMFRNFRILLRGVEVGHGLLMSPEKNAALKYMIINRGRGVAPSEFRQNLGGFSPEWLEYPITGADKAECAEAKAILQKCILVENELYFWTDHPDCEIDLQRFEDLYQAIREVSSYNQLIGTAYQEALEIYKGDLAADELRDEAFAIVRREYHEKYLMLSKKYLGYLNRASDLGAVINVCRRVLLVEPEEETMNQALSDALLRSAHNMDVNRPMDSATSTRGKMLDLFYDLVAPDNAGESVENFLRRMVKDEVSSTAFVCNYSVFRDIFRLFLCNLHRWQMNMFLVLVVLENDDRQSLEAGWHDRAEGQLFGVLSTALRKGDVITKYSPSQFALLLRMNSEKDGDVVIDRLNKRFSDNYTDDGVSLQFKIASLGQMSEEVLRR